MKSGRNKTIDITVDEGREYLERCLRAEEILKGGESLLLEQALDKTICGDAMEILPLLPRGCVDLLIVDPPYNLTKQYGGEAFHKLPPDEYERFTWNWLSLVIPLLKPDASVYVCCDWPGSMIIGPVLDECLKIRNRLTWQREKGRGAAANWKNGMEDIWFATVSDEYAFHLDAVRQRRKVIAPYRENGSPKDWEQTPDGNYRDTCPSNFWDDITIPYWSMSENTAHPAQKPEKLIAKLILASSDAGDVILDPFLGSGTTSVTAAKLGRHYIGIERSEKYCVWAEKRLEMAAEDPVIQGYADGVFWERNTAALQKQKRKK